MKYLLTLFYCSVFVATFCGCAGMRNHTDPKYKIPSISIDSTFEIIVNTEGHDNRFTRAVSNLLDSMAMNKTIVYYPNFKLSKKYPAAYTLSAKIGVAKLPDGTRGGYSFSTYLRDNTTGMIEEEFGCDGLNPSEPLHCLQYDPSKPDSTNYKELSKNMRWGSYLKNFVPFQEVLKPLNVDNQKIKSFSIDRLIIVEDEHDTKLALHLTQLLNNILVFNQVTFPKKIYKNYTQYNYYNNYQLKPSHHKHADFSIQATLRKQDADYVVDFNLIGENINLVAPEELSTTIVLGAERIKKGDYSEAMMKLSPFIMKFIRMNTLFK